jgi:endo-1,4-beta-xylanase
VRKYIYAAAVLIALLLIGFGVYKLFIQDNDPYATQPLPELPVPPLKELAERRGVQVGSFASLKYLRERPYSEILATEFEYAIIDGEPNWKFEDFTLRPSRTEFNFAHMDQVFDFADQNNMPVRVQHLLWGDDKWLPDWLKNGNYSKDELLDIIHDHISTVGEKYKGKVREYTVVNEAFSRELETGGNKDWWGERLGTEYIDKAFVWAREADPNAILVLNDFGNETKGDISNLMYDYIKGAKSRGVPIDGLGMQMHIDGMNTPSKEEVVENMRRFADLGVKIYVTEFDVNMHSVEGSDEEKDRKQAEIYSELLKACLEVGKDVCPNFGFLGLIDRQSWYKGIGIDDADPLLFRSDYTPKPAFFAVRDALQAN